MKKYFVDRIEEDILVCEDERRNQKRFSLAALNFVPRPGDALLFAGDGKLVPDEEATRKRKRIVEELQKKLFKD